MNEVWEGGWFKTEEEETETKKETGVVARTRQTARWKNARSLHDRQETMKRQFATRAIESTAPTRQE